jgi:hypothetical protein
MNVFRAFCLLTALVISALAAEQPNTLSAREKSAGWQLLFDGKSTDGWKTFKGTPASGKWVATNGWLQCLGQGGGDIITDRKYQQFELKWEWKLIKGGNSGLKYFVVTERGPIGHEYQILDNDNHPDAKMAEGKRLTAAFYDVLKCQQPAELKPPMEINRSRVLVKGNHVEHWLNGKKVLEYELGSTAVKEAVAQSKFKDAKDFGISMPGHILLQDHKDQVWYRNIKMRDLEVN